MHREFCFRAFIFFHPLLAMPKRTFKGRMPPRDAPVVDAVAAAAAEESRAKRQLRAIDTAETNALFDEALSVGALHPKTTAASDATENYHHEATMLKKRILEQRASFAHQQADRWRALIVHSSALSVVAANAGMVSSAAPAFEPSLRHECSPDACNLVVANVDEMYACVTPLEHAPSERLVDGSVLHRCSGAVYVCERTGAVHVCTTETCTQQRVDSFGVITCALTGKALGEQMAYERQLAGGQCFDSGKAMTQVVYDDVDTVRIMRAAMRYEEARPDNVALQRREDQSEVELKRSGLHPQQQQRRALLARQQALITSGRVAPLAITDKRGSDYATTAASPTTLIAPSAAPMPLISFDEFRERRIKLLQAAAVAAASGGSGSNASALSVPSALGAGMSNQPDDEQVKAWFLAQINEFFDTLERAYSLPARLVELRHAQERSAKRIADFARQSARAAAAMQLQYPQQAVAATPPQLSLSFSQAMNIYHSETESVWCGFDHALMLDAWTPWSSGAFRRQRTERLLERMWRVWCLLVRMPGFSEPYLFRSICSALLHECINGLLRPLCVRTVDNKRCAYTACTLEPNQTCVHKRINLWMIERDAELEAICSAPGIKERIRSNDHKLRRRNKLLKLYASLLDSGVLLADLPDCCVRL